MRNQLICSNRLSAVVSSITATSSFSAFSNFEPAFSPASTKSVFLETLPVTFAPAWIRRFFQTSRGSESVPVKTTIFPMNGESTISRIFTSAGETPRLRNLQLADVAADPEKNQLYFQQSLDQWPLLFQNHPAYQTLVFPEYQNAVPRC